MTKIEWTDATWNPVRGCSRVSEGCRNCYAERRANMMAGAGYRGFVRDGKWTGRVELVPSMLEIPVRWKKPRLIFVNSMSDLFHENLSNEDIRRVFDVMAQSPAHIFQILTKRSRRMRHWAKAHRASALPNVWLGVSVEDQETANDRVWDLLFTPAAKRFISYEPALGPVDFLDQSTGDRVPAQMPSGRQRRPPSVERPWSYLDDLDWVIVGGESGPGARAFDLAWARSIIQQCRDAQTPCFVKQLGAHPYERVGVGNHGGDYGEDINDLRLSHRKGGDMTEWPEDLRVREYPE